MELWELVAREAIRDSIAQYTHAGDRLLIDEVAAVFCPDATLEVRRDGRSYTGRAAIAERLGSRPERAADGPAAGRRLLRHNVTNIRFDSITPTEAGVSSYFTVLTEAGLDHFGRYRDVFVPVGDRWLIKHRLVSRDWHRRDGAT